MNIEIKKPSKKDLSNIKKLYKLAFPKSERKSFKLIMNMQKLGKMQVFAIKYNKNFCGLAIFVKYKDIVLLDYFAIMPKLQKLGIGSAALNIIKEMFRQQRLFLEIESTKNITYNCQTRLKRKNFYLKNGMTDINLQVLLFSVEMEILTDNCSISFEEYKSLYESILPKDFSNYIKKL